MTSCWSRYVRVICPRQLWARLGVAHVAVAVMVMEPCSIQVRYGAKHRTLPETVRAGRSSRRRLARQSERPHGAPCGRRFRGRFGTGRLIAATTGARVRDPRPLLEMDVDEDRLVLVDVRD